MKRRNGKTYYSSAWQMQDERQFRQSCAYCGRLFFVFAIDHVLHLQVCIWCSMILDRADVAPVVAPRSCGRACSQWCESVG